MKEGMVTNLPFARNYAGEMLRLERGRGVTLQDAAGMKYLDLGAGIAVNALGYGRRDLARIASWQMRKLVHVSNLYATGPSIDLANLLIELAKERIGSFDAVQFGNSGAEANEAAIKYARLYAHRTRGPGNHRILSFSSGFHGRTMGALSATPNKKYAEPFEPLVPGMESAPYNDAAALEKVLDGSFAGVIVEVIQGEGGLTMMSKEFAAALNSACARHDVMLIADEVQTGLGRTGTLFGSEQVGLKPNIITFSKPLAGGLPLSATMIPARLNEQLHPGDHGTTFGGGPVTTAVAAHVVRTIADAGFLARVVERGRQLTTLLDELVARKNELSARRGVGLLQGVVVEAEDPAARIAAVMNQCREAGVLLLRSSSNVIRLAPPLVIGEADLARGIRVLSDQLQ